MSDYTQRKLKHETYQECLKSKTLQEMDEKYKHIQRVTNGISTIKIRDTTKGGMCSDVFSEFSNNYSKGQLQFLEHSFKQADMDNDGKLNPMELMYWLEKQGCPVRSDQLRRMLKCADDDRDGKLSFREFVNLCILTGQTNIPSQTNLQRMNSDFRVQDTKGSEKLDYSLNSSGPNPKTTLDNTKAKDGDHQASFRKMDIMEAVNYFECEVKETISRETHSKKKATELGNYLNKGKKAQSKDMEMGSKDLWKQCNKENCSIEFRNDTTLSRDTKTKGTARDHRKIDCEPVNNSDVTCKYLPLPDKEWYSGVTRSNWKKTSSNECDSGFLR